MSVKTSPLGPFLGINNRVPDSDLARIEGGKKAGDFLRNAVNVDITTQGNLRRRPGVAQLQACSDAHSLHGTSAAMFYVDGDTLYKYPRTAVRAGLTPTLGVSYAEGPSGEVYWSNGQVLEKIVGNASVIVGVPVPNPAPSVTASTGGSLAAGRYQVAITALSADGEESGATWPIQVDVPENGRIVVAGLPGTLVNLYVSPTNGDLLFLVATTTAVTYTIPVIGQLSQQLITLGLRPMPAGTIVRWFNARLLVASNNALYYSEPFAPALHNPAKNYVLFKSPIQLVVPCDDGVYVATAEETYWLRGKDPSAAELSDVLPYGGVPGTDSKVKNSTDVWWFSTRGIVVGNTQGQAKNVQEETVAVEQAGSGAALYREQNGLRQMLTTLFNTEASTAVVSSWMDAEITRKENML